MTKKRLFSQTLFFQLPHNLEEISKSAYVDLVDKTGLGYYRYLTVLVGVSFIANV